MDALPMALRNALEAGNCVLFLGAGIGHYAKDGAGKVAPDGSALAKEIAAEFAIDVGPDAIDLAKIAQLVEIRKGRSELVAFLSRRLADLEPDENLRWLFSLTWKAIFTTNYDRIVERAYEQAVDPRQRAVSVSLSAEVVPVDQRFEVPLYHLHGALFADNPPHILITEDDYSTFRERRKMLFDILKLECATAPILYVGYSLQDPNWRIVQAELRSEFLPSEPPPSFRVSPTTSPLDEELLGAHGISTLTGNLEEFRAAVLDALGDIRVEPHKLDVLEASIPADLRQAFRESPPAVARLLTSWEYVNQASFNDPPNVEAFLKGDLPNWGLMSQRLHFERDIEDSVLDELLDYATSPVPGQRMILVSGPAGYGTSTCLMSLATRLAQERAGPVFMLKRGARVYEADVEFASSLIAGPMFFVVDNAADAANEVAVAAQRVRETKRTACLLLGERLNEWRQRRPRIHPSEFSIGSLSDAETDRLLECLRKNNALGKLGDLDYDLQFASIKVRNQKELLVTMREATEGKAFDAIIEDEYWGLKDDFSRKLYAAVCCFSRVRAHARDQMLAQLLECTLLEMFDRTRDTTEGVVVYDELDATRGIFGARSRHPTIASIVWQRTLGPADRESLLLRAVEVLNLKYPSDAQAFETFTRSDETVDGVASFDAKTRFFETACRKDPASPYVRQHYARMLRREGKLDLALAQIDQALGMDSTIRVLHHTRGVILKDLALQLESDEIARRRLAQSEAAFRQALTLYDRDEYAHRDLADLFLQWAKRVRGTDEEVEYIARAETAVSDGLRVVRVRDGLWVVSAEIQRWLGDHPGSITRLERAVVENPKAIVARYLLGRAYRRAGNLDEAQGALKPTLEEFPDEVRSAVEYALVLYDMRRPLVESIAVLQMGGGVGRRDPRYLAVLGGMLLLDGKFSEAEMLFDESRKMDFPFSEANRVEFKPRAVGGDSPLAVTGTVVAVRLGYAFVQVPGIPLSVFCAGSKLGGIVMRKGLKLRFSLCFTSRGPIVDQPEELSEVAAEEPNVKTDK